MDEDSDLPPPLIPAPKSGYASGHENTFVWTEDDLQQSEAEVAQVDTGW